MPQLAEVFAGVLGGAIDAIEDSERRHLRAQVAALAQAEGQSPTTETLLQAFDAGWTPDYFIGARLRVGADLTMSTSRERTVEGGGKVTFGPIAIEASFGNSFRQGTTTNLHVECELERQSRSSGLAYALEQLNVPSVTPPGN